MPSQGMWGLLAADGPSKGHALSRKQAHVRVASNGMLLLLRIIILYNPVQSYTPQGSGGGVGVEEFSALLHPHHPQLPPLNLAKPSVCFVLVVGVLCTTHTTIPPPSTLLPVRFVLLLVRL